MSEPWWFCMRGPVPCSMCDFGNGLWISNELDTSQLACVDCGSKHDWVHLRDALEAAALFPPGTKDARDVFCTCRKGAPLAPDCFLHVTAIERWEKKHAGP